MYDWQGEVEQKFCSSRGDTLRSLRVAIFDNGIVGVGVWVGVRVGVRVTVRVGVRVTVRVGVRVTVRVGVRVGVPACTPS